MDMPRQKIRPSLGYREITITRLRIQHGAVCTVMIGCGYCLKTVRRRRYLYFWHYENRGGRREQVEEYVGPANDSGTRETVARKVAAYAERARTEMGRFVELTRSEMATRS